MVVSRDECVDISNTTSNAQSIISTSSSENQPSVCQYHPLLRVASSVQKLSVVPEYARFQSINRSLFDLLASFVSCSISKFICYYCLFVIILCVLLALLYPIRCHSTWLTLQFAFLVFVIVFLPSHSLRPHNNHQSLYNKES